MRKSEWLPVRCCCTPDKIFGFLQVEETEFTPVVVDRTGRPHVLEIRTFSDCRRVYASFDLEQRKVPVPLRRDGHRERAVYSDDRPIEFWRSIPGFVEALRATEHDDAG